MKRDSNASIPDRSSRQACRLESAPHPAVLDVDLLAKDCQLRTQRRSGPGGQHRNKTSSGVFMEHRPTGLIGEATERRSQAQNRDVALRRLRYVLALAIRTPSPIDCGPDDHPSDHDDLEQNIRQRYRRHSLKLNEENVDKPALLAMLLNDLWASGGQPSLVAPLWSTSTSKIVMLLRSYPPAIAWVNSVRDHHGRLPLH
ncbi:peptide chain release factor family protein [Roseiconus lacunae]|uniref:Peptide chain release factor-like protein n=1 Tax=Roseiconus lacunae TaxID=2605694 RepID=A0ABT7PGC1_9BACT|nr:peptide chain release factor-like protein [Roseiconus lacunae]MDM4015538.1 peptide chain release factor-like protein [Roseiconus lacunae]